MLLKLINIFKTKSDLLDFVGNLKLSGADLEDANLKGADLIDFVGNLKLRGDNLEDANLRGDDLIDCEEILTKLDLCKKLTLSI